MKKAEYFLGSMFLCFFPGWIGSVFTAQSVHTPWFEQLVKPGFYPPAAAFGIVWTLLYVLMGVSLFYVLETPTDSKKKLALGLFGVQLVLNGLWPYLFFGLQRLDLALIEIVFLWGFILATIICMTKIQKKSAYLLLPYWLWVSFATVLNASMWWLNLV